MVRTADKARDNCILEDFEDTIIPSLIGGTDKTGHADYYWRSEDAAGTNVYIPAGSGGAYYGSNLGVSVLNSNNVLSNANPNYGSALANYIPIIAIMTQKKVVSWEMATMRI